MLLLKRDLSIPVIISVLPICLVSLVILDLPALAIFPLLAGAAVAMGYSAILHYLAVESGMRPVLLDINSSLSPRQRTDFWAVSLRTRLHGRAAADQPDHRARGRGAHVRRRRLDRPRRSMC